MTEKRYKRLIKAGLTNKDLNKMIEIEIWRLEQNGS